MNGIIYSHPVCRPLLNITALLYTNAFWLSICFCHIDSVILIARCCINIVWIWSQMDFEVEIWV